MYKRNFLILFFTCMTAYLLGACQAHGDFTGREYMPDMAHSKAYEPYVEGRTIMIGGDTVQLFANNQAALQPVEGTVARGYVPYHYEDTNEGYELAGKELVSPVNRRDEDVLAKGKAAYATNCAICHGSKGAADGAIVKNGAYPAPPPSYFREDILVLSEGKMFHSVHYGKNLMGSYASQLSKEERWNVVAYIKKMQAEKIAKDYNISLNQAYQVALGKAPMPAEAVKSDSSNADGASDEAVEEVEDASSVTAAEEDAPPSLEDIAEKPLEAGTNIVLNNVLFESSSSKLKNSSYTELNKLVEILKKNPSTKVEIAGHTDSKGSKAGNDRISKARADVVVKYLGSKGIDTKMLTAKGYGSSQPVASNDTAGGRAKNRRTEFKVIK